MNFTFTWILDKFGFTPKIETFDFPVKSAAKKVAKKSIKVAAKKTSVPKATTRKKKT
jgi:hypothetical protein